MFSGAGTCCRHPEVRALFSARLEGRRHNVIMAVILRGSQVLAPQDDETRFAGSVAKIMLYAPARLNDMQETRCA
ncbi:MAG: hypothetical protein BGN84_00735 [Afipia sp. 62-7]|nr:MAG: hypothetical protein BGN84_00735 [Afipia sp. 62-7]